MDEYTGGVDLGLTRDLTVRLNVVRKLDWGGSKELDLAQPFEAFTDRRTGVDPGRDNIAGTADDGIVEVWSVPRTYPTFGQVIRLDDQHRAGRRRGQVLGVRDRRPASATSTGWSLLASYSIDRRDVSATSQPRNPNRERATTGSCRRPTRACG